MLHGLIGDNGTDCTTGYATASIDQSPQQKPPRQPGRAVDVTARIERRQVLGGLISE